jgi:hypothetical protein
MVGMPRAGVAITNGVAVDGCIRDAAGGIAISGLGVGLYGLIIIIIVPVMVPRSRVVAEMKPYAWGDVHGCAGTTVVSPIAYVVVPNVTTAV